MERNTDPMGADMDRWIAEHGADYEVPDAVLALVADGLAIDDSWHNDSCPRFSYRHVVDAGHGIEDVVDLWVEHPNSWSRETNTARFIVMIGDGGGEADHEVWTDDVHEACAAFIAMREAAVRGSHGRA